MMSPQASSQQTGLVAKPFLVEVSHPTRIFWALGQEEMLSASVVSWDVTTSVPVSPQPLLRPLTKQANERADLERIWRPPASPPPCVPAPPRAAASRGQALHLPTADAAS